MISEWTFGTLPDGRRVRAFELQAESGLRATVLDYGAILQSVKLPDGRNLVLSFSTLDDYLTDRNYIGQLIGRNTNRIVGAAFEIEGETHTLPANDGANNLHGGPHGFGQALWQGQVDGETLLLSHSSPDQDQGFPGEIQVDLRITLSSDTLRLDMRATTTRATPVNLTWHPYWNLNAKGRIDGHDLCLSAESRTELMADRPKDVTGTRFDFRKALPLGSVCLDDNYVDVAQAILTARATTLRMTSSLPDMQAYTGDNLPKPRSGLALEPQFRPNDINTDRRSLLEPGETYAHWINYRIDDPSLTKR